MLGGAIESCAERGEKERGLEWGETMKGSEGPTSAASFHSRFPWNLTEDIIRPSILSSTWPLGVHPTKIYLPCDAPRVGHYLDRLDLAYESRCHSKLRSYFPGELSPPLAFPSFSSLSLPPCCRFTDTEDPRCIGVRLSLENVYS